VSRGHANNRKTDLESSQIDGFLANVRGGERRNEIVDGEVETHVGGAATTVRGTLYKQSISDSGPASIRQIHQHETRNCSATNHLIKHTTVIISSTPTITAMNSILSFSYHSLTRIFRPVVYFPRSTQIVVTSLTDL